MHVMTTVFLLNPHQIPSSAILLEAGQGRNNARKDDVEDDHSPLIPKTMYSTVNYSGVGRAALFRLFKLTNTHKTRPSQANISLFVKSAKNPSLEKKSAKVIQLLLVQ
jgi:hypothetical protein